MSASTQPSSVTDKAQHEHDVAQANRRSLLLEFLVKVKHQISLLPSKDKHDRREKDEKGRPINTLDAIAKSVKMLSVELRHEYPLMTKPLEQLGADEAEQPTNTEQDEFAGLVLKFPAVKETRDESREKRDKPKRSRKKQA